MVWDKKWTGKRKKEKPNRMRQKPTIGFRSNLHPETLGYIKRLAEIKQKSNFINQAIEMKYFLTKNKRQFLKQMLQEDYFICRDLLRRIGNKK